MTAHWTIDYTASGGSYARWPINKMKATRPIHLDFQHFLKFKDKEVIDLFTDLREYILELYPDSNELLYHTHALTAVFSISENCRTPFVCCRSIPTTWTWVSTRGRCWRIRISSWTAPEIWSGTSMWRNQVITGIRKWKALIKAAIDFAIKDMEKPTKSVGKTISKIAKKWKR